MNSCDPWPTDAGNLDVVTIDAPADLDARNPGIARAGNFAGKCGAVLQTLSIYGALGIASFGWVLSRLLRFDGARYIPLWFCSALFIYNIDRLKADPADFINTPSRSRSAARLRKSSRALAAISAAALVVVPIIERDLLMLFLTTGGALVCMNYSVPMLGFRFKDVPFLKSFFAPALVTAAFLVPPLVQQAPGASAACYATVAAWTFYVTLFNMILCDLRDIAGDAGTGIRSLPVAVGYRRTIYILAMLVALGAALSVAVLFECSPATAASWTFISIMMTIYLAALLAVMRKPMPEGFYEWWVEGILLVPALVYVITL